MSQVPSTSSELTPEQVGQSLQTLYKENTNARTVLSWFSNMSDIGHDARGYTVQTIAKATDLDMPSVRHSLQQIANATGDQLTGSGPEERIIFQRFTSRSIGQTGAGSGELQRRGVGVTA